MFHNSRLSLEDLKEIGRSLLAGDGQSWMVVAIFLFFLLLASHGCYQGEVNDYYLG
jgi:hypothetical protein